MGITTLTADKVTCQNCDATILVEHWQDARKVGWAVPCDGHLQLCPLCAQYRRGQLSATAIPIGSLAEKLPGEE